MTDTTSAQKNNPLHGLTLEKILTELVEYYGWVKLSTIMEVRCFYNNPSIKSSLIFLRKTPWARTKIENLFLDMRWHIKKLDSKRR